MPGFPCWTNRIKWWRDWETMWRMWSPIKKSAVETPRLGNPVNSYIHMTLLDAGLVGTNRTNLQTQKNLLRNDPIDPALFRLNRKRLLDRLPNNSIAVINSNDLMPSNADGTLPYHPNADLFYLSGIEHEQSILVLDPYASNTPEIDPFFSSVNRHLF